MKIRKRVANAILPALAVSKSEPDMFLNMVENKLRDVFDLFFDGWGFREKLHQRVGVINARYKKRLKAQQAGRESGRNFYPQLADHQPPRRNQYPSNSSDGELQTLGTNPHGGARIHYQRKRNVRNLNPIFLKQPYSPGPWNRKQTGLTLIELMVALACASLVMAAIVGVYAAVSKSYTTQNVAADIQQVVRATVDYMAEDIMMVGINPNEIANVGFQEASSARMRFTADRDMDGDTDDAFEDITYEIGGNQLQQTDHLGARYCSPISMRASQRLFTSMRTAIRWGIRWPI